MGDTMNTTPNANFSGYYHAALSNQRARVTPGYAEYRWDIYYQNGQRETGVTGTDLALRISSRLLEPERDPSEPEPAAPFCREHRKIDPDCPVCQREFSAAQPPERVCACGCGARVYHAPYASDECLARDPEACVVTNCERPRAAGSRSCQAHTALAQL
jgi:hypothetical protein